MRYEKTPPLKESTAQGYIFGLRALTGETIKHRGQCHGGLGRFLREVIALAFHAIGNGLGDIGGVDVRYSFRQSPDLKIRKTQDLSNFSRAAEGRLSNSLSPNLIHWKTTSKRNRSLIINSCPTIWPHGGGI